MREKPRLTRKLPYKKLPRNTGSSVISIPFKVNSTMKKKKKLSKPREMNKLRFTDRMKLRNCP
jgi:hypothetical protein